MNYKIVSIIKTKTKSPSTPQNLESIKIQNTDILKLLFECC